MSEHLHLIFLQKGFKSLPSAIPLRTDREIEKTTFVGGKVHNVLNPTLCAMSSLLQQSRSILKVEAKKDFKSAQLETCLQNCHCRFLSIHKALADVPAWTPVVHSCRVIFHLTLFHRRSFNKATGGCRSSWNISNRMRKLYRIDLADKKRVVSVTGDSLTVITAAKMYMWNDGVQSWISITMARL